MMSADEAQICSVWLPPRKPLDGWPRLCFYIALWLPSVLRVQYTGLNKAVIFDHELAKLSNEVEVNQPHLATVVVLHIGHTPYGAS